MRGIWKYLRGNRAESVLAPLFKLLEASLELAVPLVVAAVIDRGIGNADRAFTVRMCLLLALLGLVGLLFSVTAQFFAAKAAVGFTTRLRSALYAHIQDFSYSTLDRVGIPTLMTRMTSDMNQVQTGLNLTLRLLLRSPFVVFGAMVMAFTIDVSSALWFAAAIPVLSAVVFGVMLVSMPLYKKAQELLDRVLGSTRETLTGVRVLRAFGKEESEVRAFDAHNEALTGMQRHVGRISALLNPLTYVLINLAILALIRTGAIQVRAGVLNQGQVVALYNYMSQILVELIKMANLIVNITRSIAGGKRIRSVLDISAGEPEVSGCPAGDPSCRVEFRDVTLQYDEAGAPSLQHIDLKAYAGETIGVIGGTGSGKTSLVNLIPRFYTATAGQVFVDGADVRSVPVQTLRRRIGIVPQKAVVLSGTIRDNLLWGDADASEETLLQAVQTAQAQDVVREKGGLDGRRKLFG